MLVVLLITFVLLIPESASAQESLQLKGQISSYVNYNSSGSYKYHSGARYIPDLSPSFAFSDNLIDAEFSVNIFHNSAFSENGKPINDGRIKPYRLWLRYSSDQFEIRAGMQKINFGSATMLRPLMWFDKLDPRDPLQLTDGVYALLARYYFLDNTNIWLWSLYGNSDLKTWEISKTTGNIPEFGGRIQTPLFDGEGGITFHTRETDISSFSGAFSGLGSVRENRIGLDGKWDIEAGVWFEAAWINRNADCGLLRNQEVITLGSDYTFNLGSGLNVMAEHLIASADQTPLKFISTGNFSAFFASYPLTVVDMVNGIVYFDWKGSNVYTFANWQMTWDNVLLNVMAFWNPESFNLPQQNDAAAMFGGKGIQIIFAYNH